MARRRSRRYRYTPRRRAALKKAQLISARKRRGKQVAVGVALAGIAVGGGLLAKHKFRSSKANARPAGKVTVPAVTVKAPAGPSPKLTGTKAKTRSRGIVEEADDLSHISNIGRRYRAEIAEAGGGGGSAGSAPDRTIGWGTYANPERPLSQYRGSNPLVRRIMSEAR